jgi:hypothetical protein
VGQAFGSRTYAGLATVTVGIAAALPGAGPVHGPGPARPPASKAETCVIVWLILVTATLVAALLAGDPLLAVLAMIGGLAVIGGLAEARAVTARSRYQEAIPGTATPQPVPSASFPLSVILMHFGTWQARWIAAVSC